MGEGWDEGTRAHPSSRRNISPYSHFTPVVYIFIVFHYCYVITFDKIKVHMSLFSLSSPARLLLALVLILFLGLAVRWAVALP